MPILNAVLLLCCLAAILALDAFFIEPNWLSLEIIEIPIEGLPDSFDGYRIALLSDFHYPRAVEVDFLRKAVALANTFHPDLVALTGDFCDNNRDDPHSVPHLSGLFDGFEALDGIVGVLGNHDHWIGADGIRKEITNHTPIRLIENQSFSIEREGHAIAIGGIGDLWEGVIDVQRTFAGLPDTMPRILLSHNPDTAEELDRAIRVDLQLSGHTHGGQVRIPFGPALKIPSRYGNKFRAGLVQGHSHRVYVTRGVCSVRHVRFWCRPEVTGIILRQAVSP